jgi:tRNA-Thr(GGU) m(6)t(6)A37 methyltransferase TsaA
MADRGSSPRPGEIWLDEEPGRATCDARLVFIGIVRSPWREGTPPPKNPREARERGEPAVIEITAPYRQGLAGLERFSHVWVFAWLDRARRAPLVIRPPHANEPRGVFALRSPVRPNPIGLTVCRLVRLDPRAGTIEVDAIDFLDGTPVIDIKPYRPGIDAVPDAVIG